MGAACTCEGGVCTGNCAPKADDCSCGTCEKCMAKKAEGGDMPAAPAEGSEM